MTLVVANDRFTKKGVELQKTSKNLEQAIERFNQSCTRCSLYKRNADCEACPIRESLFGNACKFKGQPSDYEWLEKEFIPV